MTSSYSPSRSLGLLSSLAAATLLAGCSMGTLSLSGPASPVTSAVALSGNVHGGQQPVSGATLYLYALNGSTTTNLLPAGSYFPGGAPNCVASATQTCTSAPQSDAGGNFTITGDYACPAGNTSAPVVIVAAGGNPGLPVTVSNPTPSNPSLSLATALGSCSTLLSTLPTISINEVTSAAAAIALGHYYVPSTASFSGPSSTVGKAGLLNAFSTVKSLVNSSTGAAIASTTLTGAGVTLTAVPEPTKLNTIADILAACVSSTGISDPGGACSTLFADVVPTGGTTVQDTLTAAVYLATNPTSNNANGSAANIAALFGLITPNAPYPSLTAAPSDWTIGIQYQDNSGTFFLKPQNIAIDSIGNIWVLSNNGGLGGLVQVGPTGTPLSVVSTLDEYGPFASPIASPPALSSPKTTTTTFATQNTLVTSTFGGATSNPAINPRNLAIDPSNNVWFTQSSSTTSSNGGTGSQTIPVSGNVFEVATSSATGIPTGSTFSFATGKSAYGLAIDSTGDVFVGEQSSSAYFGVYEFPANATPGNGLLTPVGFIPDSTTAVPEYMSLDKSGDILFTSAAAGATPAYQLTGASATSCGTLTANSLCQPATTSYSYANVTVPSTATQPYGVAEGSTGTWIASTAGNSLELVTFGTTSATSAFGDASHFTAPKFPAVDGDGNVWVANSNGPGTATTTGGSISALTSAGAYLSPTNNASTSIAPGFAHLGLNFGLGTAVDPSGNVWVANNAVFSAACSSTLTATSNTCSSIFELVGAAAPVVTPIAAASVTGPTRP